MFIVLIQREEGNTAYRDIGPKMERELFNHIGDVPYTLPGRSFYDCPTSDIVPVQIVGMCWTYIRGLFSSIVHRCPCHGAPYRYLPWLRMDPRRITGNLAASPCSHSVNECAARVH